MISVKDIREDAEIMERANINPNLPEVIFSQNVKQKIQEFLEKLKEWETNPEFHDFLDKLAEDKFGDKILK